MNLSHRLDGNVEPVVLYGGYCRITRVWDAEQGRWTAHKQPIAEVSGSLLHWQREQEVLAEINHPNLVRCLAVRRAPPTLVLEWLDGPGFATGQRWPAATVKTWLTALLEVVGHLHDSGWVHGDLQLGNLLHDHHGQLRLLDLGNAQRRAAAKPSTIGALHYMVINPSRSPPTCMPWV
jgi:eukaryotic-like serine/threonine-protein kinase